MSNMSSTEVETPSHKDNFIQGLLMGFLLMIAWQIL